MYLVSNEEMRALDRSAIEEWHIPSLVLMENAGIAIMRQLEKDVEHLAAKRITISVVVATMAVMAWCWRVSSIWQVRIMLRWRSS